MLNSFRSFQGSIFIKILLALLVLSFAAWGVGDMLGGSSARMVVAEVGNEKIYAQTYMRELQSESENIKRSLGGNYSPELLKQLQVEKFVMQRLVQQSLLAQESKALGIVPSDKEVAKQIQQNKLFLDSQGAFDKKRFASFLNIQGLAEKDYVEKLRTQLASAVLVASLGGNITPPSIAAKYVVASNDEKRDIVIYQLDADAVTAPETASDQELDDYYKRNIQRYIAPEYRQVSYLSFDADDVIKQAPKITEEKIRSYYKEHIENYKQPPMRDISQLLYASEEEANKAYALLAGGKNFEQVASEVPPLNKGNINLGKVTQQALLAEASASVFALEKNAATTPIKSTFGWHIFKVNAIIAAGITPLEDVRDGIEAELKQSSRDTALSDKTNAIEDALAGGSTLKEVAVQLGLKYSDVGTFDKNGADALGKKLPLPTWDKFIDTAFKTEEKTESTLIASKNGEYYMVHVEKIIPERTRPLNEVKTEVLSDWKHAARTEALTQFATSASKKLAEDKTRDATLAQLNLIAEGHIKRTDRSLQGIDLPQGLITEIFASPKAHVSNPYATKNGAFLITQTRDILSVAISQDAKPSPATREASEQLATTMQDEIFEQYMRYLEKKYSVSLNVKNLRNITPEP